VPGVDAYFIFLIFLVRVSATIASVVCYISTSRVTPVLNVSTVFSLVNVFARSVSLSSPYVARYFDNPLLSITLINLFGVLGTLFLEEDTKDD